MGQPLAHDWHSEADTLQRTRMRPVTGLETGPIQHESRRRGCRWMLEMLANLNAGKLRIPGKNHWGRSKRGTQDTPLETILTLVMRLAWPPRGETVDRWAAYKHHYPEQSRYACGGARESPRVDIWSGVDAADKAEQLTAEGPSWKPKRNSAKWCSLSSPETAR